MTTSLHRQLYPIPRKSRHPSSLRQMTLILAQPWSHLPESRLRLSPPRPPLPNELSPRYLIPPLLLLLLVQLKPMLPRTNPPLRIIPVLYRAALPRRIEHLPHTRPVLCQRPPRRLRKRTRTLISSIILRRGLLSLSLSLKHLKPTPTLMTAPFARAHSTRTGS